MRAFLALVLSLCLAFPAAAEVVSTADGLKRADWFADADRRDFPALLARAKAEGKRLAVVWQAPGDADSAKLIERNFTHPKLADYARTHFLVTTLNFMGEDAVTMPDGKTATEAEAAAGLSLTLLPTTVFHNDDGSEMFRLDGYIAPRFYFAGLMFVASGEHADPQYRGMFVRWARANSTRVRDIFGDPVDPAEADAPIER